MYIDAEGKESPELKVTPLKGRKWVSRRERQCKVSGRRKRRRGGRIHRNQENGENGVRDFSGMKREVKTPPPPCKTIKGFSFLPPSLSLLPLT